MKDSSMAHTANCTVAGLEEVFNLQVYQIWIRTIIICM
jgi:hypothetical protein